VSLQDSNDFGGKELTGTSLFVYGFSYGINNGLLAKRKYLPAVSRAWKTLTKDCLHANGFLGFVQGTGKEPKDSQPVGYDNVPDFEDFGLGCFLLAGSEVYKIKK
jgi:rhamnogalacturonyl hydrolase YesR